MMRAVIVIGTYTILNILAVFLMDRWLSRCSDKYRENVAARVIIDFLYIVIAAVPVLGNFILDKEAQFFVNRFSYIWLGYLMYFGGLLLIATIVDLIVIGVYKARSKGSAEGKRHTGIYKLVFVLLIIVPVGLNAYGMIHARDTVIKEYNVKIDKKVERTKEYRIALIADLHIAENSSESMMKNMVDLVNEQDPDVVLVGGDLFSSNYYGVAHPKRYEKILSRIESDEGVYWVYGNHDVQEPLFCGFALRDPEFALRSREMDDFIEKSGFTPLADEAVTLAGGEIQLVGRKDMSKTGDGTKKRMDAGKLLSNLDKNKPIIVLEHEPADYKALAKGGADISLSGHTHAGQVFPGTIVTRLLNDMVYGLDTRAGMQVLVTSGVGFYGAPLRIGTNSEVVIINMTFR